MRRRPRESQWLVIRRCLAILRRAERGPASGQALVQAALAQEGPEAYGEAPQRQLEKDLERIRGHLRVDLFYDRGAGGYAIRDTWLPLLDLPDEDLATIAWLEETFGHDSPQHDEVQGLLARLRLLLGTERCGEIERRRTALVLDLQRRDEDRIAPGVWEGLSRALAGRRRIEILYTSPQHADRTPRRHVVDPWGRYFDPARGHYYLHGWCHYSVGAEGRREEDTSRTTLHRKWVLRECVTAPLGQVGSSRDGLLAADIAV